VAQNVRPWVQTLVSQTQKELYLKGAEECSQSNWRPFGAKRIWMAMSWGCLTISSPYLTTYPEMVLISALGCYCSMQKLGGSNLLHWVN
jgi:hypothetical protein